MSLRAGNSAGCRKEAGGRPQPIDILREAQEPRFICRSGTHTIQKLTFNSEILIICKNQLTLES